MTRNYHAQWIRSPEVVEETENWFQNHRAAVETMVKSLLEGKPLEEAAAPVSEFVDKSNLLLGRNRSELKTADWLWLDMMAGAVELRPVSQDYAIRYERSRNPVDSNVETRGMFVKTIQDNWQIIQRPIEEFLMPRIFNLANSAFLPLASIAIALCLVHLIVWPGRILRAWILRNDSMSRRITAALRWNRWRNIAVCALLVLVPAIFILTPGRADSTPYIVVLVLAIAAWLAIGYAIRWKALIGGSGLIPLAETLSQKVPATTTAELNATRRAAISKFHATHQSQLLHEGITEPSLQSFIGPYVRLSSVSVLSLTPIAVFIVLIAHDSSDKAGRERFGEIPKDWIVSKNSREIEEDAVIRGRVAIIDRPSLQLRTDYQNRLPEHLRAVSPENADTIITVWLDTRTEGRTIASETTITYDARTGRELGRSSDEKRTYETSSYYYVDVYDRRSGTRYPTERLPGRHPGSNDQRNHALDWILGLSRISVTSEALPLK